MTYMVKRYENMTKLVDIHLGRKLRHQLFDGLQGLSVTILRHWVKAGDHEYIIFKLRLNLLIQR